MLCRLIRTPASTTRTSIGFPLIKSLIAFLMCFLMSCQLFKRSSVCCIAAGNNARQPTNILFPLTLCPQLARRFRLTTRPLLIPP